jgi:hypothetical protein
VGQACDLANLDQQKLHKRRRYRDGGGEAAGLGKHFSSQLETKLDLDKRWREEETADLCFACLRCCALD